MLQYFKKVILIFLLNNCQVEWIGKDDSHYQILTVKLIKCFSLKVFTLVKLINLS